MFLIVNENNQVFSRLTSFSMLGSENWVSKIELDHMVPIQVTIYPDESTATSTINNLQAFRKQFGMNTRRQKENLRVIPFTEYFKG